MKWVKRWKEPSHSNPSKEYTVAITDQGEWGCDCPVWKFKRKTCKHILAVQKRAFIGGPPETVEEHKAKIQVDTPAKGKPLPILQEWRYPWDLLITTYVWKDASMTCSCGRWAKYKNCSHVEMVLTAHAKDLTKLPDGFERTYPKPAEPTAVIPPAVAILPQTRSRAGFLEL